MDELQVYYLKEPRKADKMPDETKVNKVKPLQQYNSFFRTRTPVVPAFEEKKVSPAWGDLIADFFDVTSLHGIRYCTKVNGVVLIRRILWAILVIGLMVISIYYLADRVEKYLKFEQSISVEENYVESMPFPAITICNQNLFSLTEAAKGNWYNVAKDLSTASSTSTSGGASSSCANGVQCTSGSRACISQSQQCDGFPDCSLYEDERNCSRCVRLVISGTATSPPSGYSDIIRTTFVLQSNTHFSTKPAYMSEKPDSPLAIYYDGDTSKWVISRAFGKNIIATASQATASPQEVTSAWKFVARNVDVNLNFTCAEHPLFYNVSEKKQNDDSITLENLFKDAGSKLQKMLVDCKWKGQVCKTTDFVETVTDMGVCYTFGKNNRSVQGPGPGSGLAVTMNIAHYDYTKSGASGVQILMHEPSDTPVMSGQSLAVSPGLISLVALERAQIKNLAPPWGNCTKDKLKYYDTFTDNTCKLECENIYVREACDCIDYYMPKKDSKPVCTAAQYLNCVRPKLTEKKKDTKFCVCGLPCENTVFVPSLSFATYNADPEALDSKAEDVVQTVTAANEEARKVDEDKYRETARIINTGYLGLTNFQNFLLALEGQLNDSKTTLQDVSVLAGADCHTLSGGHKNIIAEIGASLERAINTFSVYYETSTYDSIIKFIEIVKNLTDPYDSVELDYLHSRKKELHFQQENSNISVDYVSMSLDNISVTINMDYNTMNLSELIDMNITLPNTTTFATNFQVRVNSSVLYAQNSSVTFPDEQFWNHTTDIWIRFATLRSATQRAMASVQLTVNKLVKQLEDRINAVAFADFVLKVDLVRFIQPEMTSSCVWCYDSNGNDFVQILKTALLNVVGNIKPKLRVMESSLYLIYNDTLKSMTTGSPSMSSITTRLVTLATESESLITKLESDMMKKLKEGMNFIQNLLQLFDLKCLTVSAMTRALDDNHIKTYTILEEIITSVDEERKHFYQESNLFTIGRMNLSTLSSSLDRTGKTDLVAARVSSLEDVLLDRKILMEGFVRKVNNVYFWSMTMWKYSYLANVSQFWKRFSITNPDSSTTSSAAIPQIGDASASDLLIMKGTQSSQTFWDDLLQKVITMVENVKQNYDLFTTTRNKVQAFFVAFLESNKIGASFYSSNYLKLDVYYKALTDKKVLQKKAYELPALLSEVGGLMGLLVGASLITVFEYIDLFLYNGIVKYREKRDDDKKEKKSPPPN